MSVTVSLAADGQMTLQFEGKSVEQALALARGVVPDIDQRYADLVGMFRPGDGYGDPGTDRPFPGPGPTGGAAVPPQSPDPGKRPNPVESQEDEATTEEEGKLTCAVCGGESPPDYAALQLEQHGEVRCPTHGTLP